VDGDHALHLPPSSLSTGKAEGSYARSSRFSPLSPFSLLTLTREKRQKSWRRGPLIPSSPREGFIFCFSRGRERDVDRLFFFFLLLLSLREEKQTGSLPPSPFLREPWRSAASSPASLLPFSRGEVSHRLHLFPSPPPPYLENARYPRPIFLSLFPLLRLLSLPLPLSRPPSVRASVPSSLSPLPGMQAAPPPPFLVIEDYPFPTSLLPSGSSRKRERKSRALLLFRGPRRTAASLLLSFFPPSFFSSRSRRHGIAVAAFVFFFSSLCSPGPFPSRLFGREGREEG